MDYLSIDKILSHCKYRSDGIYSFGKWFVTTDDIISSINGDSMHTIHTIVIYREHPDYRKFVLSYDSIECVVGDDTQIHILLKADGYDDIHTEISLYREVYVEENNDID